MYMYILSVFLVQMAEGVGLLLFEVCKGVPRQFHSCTETVLIQVFIVTNLLFVVCLFEQVLPTLLSKFCGSANFVNSEVVFQSLCKMVERMAEHTRGEFSTPVWTPLLVRTV